MLRLMSFIPPGSSGASIVRSAVIYKCRAHFKQMDGFAKLKTFHESTAIRKKTDYS